MRSFSIARRRRGFVLLAVLWVLVGLASLGLALATVGRDAVGAAQNRVSLARAHWLAEGCLEASRAVIADELAEQARADAAWRTLDDLLARSPLLTGAKCDVSARALGTSLDVNAADAEQLQRLFLALHVPQSTADSLVDALLDWRDPDDDPRPYGAERPWYTDSRRIAPRNGAIADVRELARVRGFEQLMGLDSALGVEPGRIALGRAPRAVLVTLPGFSDELVERVIALRERGELPSDLLSLVGSLSSAARDSLAARYAEVVPLVTVDPTGWTLTARASDPGSPALATVEVRVMRAGARTATVRHRSWP